MEALAARLARLPKTRILGVEVAVATGRHARLLGLALLPRERAGTGLLIPRCSDIHTFGMRFELDVCFLDEDGRSTSWRLGVGPHRFLREPGASAVLELPAGGELFPPAP